MTIKQYYSHQDFRRFNTGNATTKVDRVSTLSYRNGNELPNHRSLIDSRVNATTALSATRETFAFSGGVTRYDNYFGGVFYPHTDTYQGLEFVKVTDSGVQDFSMHPGLVNQAKAEAISHFYQRVRDLQTPFESGIFLGEAKETIKLLKSPHKSTANLLAAWRNAIFERRRKYKRKGLSDGKALAKAHADSWLEYRFAILPLVSDMQSIIKLASEKTQRKQLERVRGYGKAESAPSITSYVNGNHTIQLKRVVRVENIIRGGVIMDHLEKYESLSGRLGDTFDDISSLPVTMYELTPYSFVLDYFVNVGDIISAGVTSTSNVSYVSNSLVLTVEEVRTTIEANYPYVRSFSPSQSTCIFRRVLRDGALQAIPPVVFHLPGSNIRYANLAALSVSKLL